MTAVAQPKRDTAPPEIKLVTQVFIGLYLAEIVKQVLEVANAWLHPEAILAAAAAAGAAQPELPGVMQKFSVVAAQVFASILWLLMIAIGFWAIALLQKQHKRTLWSRSVIQIIFLVWIIRLVSLWPIQSGNVILVSSCIEIAIAAFAGAGLYYLYREESVDWVEKSQAS